MDSGEHLKSRTATATPSPSPSPSRAWLMNLMQLFRFRLCFLRALRIVAWHFLPYSSDVFAHELCVFMIYVCAQVVLEPSPALRLCSELPAPAHTKCNAARLRPGPAWPALDRLCLGFSPVTCCVAVGFLRVRFAWLAARYAAYDICSVSHAPSSQIYLVSSPMKLLQFFAIFDFDFDSIQFDLI